jgi:hypothetical protein
MCRSFGELFISCTLCSASDSKLTGREAMVLELLGRRRRRYPSLQAFVNLAAPTEAKRPAGSTLRPLHYNEGLQRGCPVPRPHPTWRPTWDSAHCNRPRTEKCVMGPTCNGFSVMTVCNPPLWEYSGDSPGA